MGIKNLPRSFGFKGFYYLTCLMLCVALGGCGDTKDKKEMPPPDVSIFKIVPKTVFPHEEYTGRTTGVLQVDVRAQVGGILMEQIYTEGSKVKEGDVLFRIDPAPLQASLEQAIAALEDAKARLTYAESEWKRVQGLFKKKAVSTKERDEALANVDQMRASVEQSEAAVKLAEINLGYATVRAPITGITGQAQITIGNLIGTTAETNLLTQMTQLDPMYVEFAYPDNALLKFQRITGKNDLTALQSLSLKATLKLADGRDYPHEGYVDFTSSEINQKTGSVDARALIPNPAGELLPGQFVRVTIKGLELKNAILIPEKAVMQMPGGTFVFVLDEQNKAHMRPITLGMSIDKEVLVENGLKAGDTVITDGMIKVRPGSLVKVPSPGASHTPSVEHKP